MPARKKRTPSPKSAHIAVQAQVSSMEDVEPVSDMQPDAAVVPPVIEKSDVTSQVSKPPTVLPKEDSLEAMLANDAPEPELTRTNIWLYRFGMATTGAIIVLSLILYLIYLKSSAMPLASVEPTSAPTPVPTVTVDVKTITLEVLNGSGVAGKASKTAEALKAKGYSIAVTGNAKKIPSTTVIFASALSDRAKEIVLADLQSIGISSISSMLGDSSVSARITLGLK